MAYGFAGISRYDIACSPYPKVQKSWKSVRVEDHGTAYRQLPHVAPCRRKDHEAHQRPQRSCRLKAKDGSPAGKRARTPALVGVLSGLRNVLRHRFGEVVEEEPARMSVHGSTLVGAAPSWTSLRGSDDCD